MHGASLSEWKGWKTVLRDEGLADDIDFRTRIHQSLD
jgi:hypothetical protein